MCLGKLLNGDLTSKDKDNKEFIKRQVLVLKAFNELKESGDNLNTVVQASQIDTKRFGSNITELRVFINKIRKAYDLQKEATGRPDTFINLEKVLPYDPDLGKAISVENANFLGTYAANAIKFSLDVMGDLSIYATPLFEEIFNKLVRVTGNQFTTDAKFVNAISDEIFNAIVSKFFTDEKYIGLDHTKVESLFNYLIGKLLDIKNNLNGKYDDLKDNDFLKYISFIPTEEGSILPFTMFISVPIKSVKDKPDKDNMIAAFMDLLKDSRPEVNSLAKQLFYYGYFASGYRSRIYSYFNFIPNEMFKTLDIKDPLDIHKTKSVSYDSMIKDILAEMKNEMNAAIYDVIVDEVIDNNHDNDTLIRVVEPYGLSNTIFEYKGKKYDRPIAVTLKPELAERYNLANNGDGLPIYRPTIKIYDEKLGHVPMRYIGFIRVETDKPGITNIHPVYVTKNMRSYNSRGVVVREYGLSQSIIKPYNELAVITPAMEEEFMIHLADGRAYKYIPKGEQLLITNQPGSQVGEDESIS